MLDQVAKGTAFILDDIKYDLNKLLSLTYYRLGRYFSTSELAWVLEHNIPDPIRIREADLSDAILLAYDKEGRLTVIDGRDRLAKALIRHWPSIKGKLVTQEDLNEVKMK